MTLNKSAFGLCAVVLAIASLSSAHAATVASAEATVSNLRFRLIDLAPNDGIAPSVRFDTVMRPYINYDAPIEVQGFNLGDMVGATETTALSDLPDNVALYSGQSLGGRIALDDSQLSPDTFFTQQYTNRYASYGLDPNTGNLVSGTQEVVYTDTGGGSYATGSWISAGAIDGTTLSESNLVLSPHTVLVLEGTSDLAVTLDPTHFQSVLDNTAFTTDYSFSYSAAYVNLRLISADPNNGMPDASGINRESLQSRTFTSMARLSYYAGGDTVYEGQPGTFEEVALSPEAMAAGAPYQQTRRENFLISFANGSSNESVVLLGLSVVTESSEQIQGRTDISSTFTPDTTLPTTPMIPEPSTWALMGLGLAGIGWAARRRQQSV